MSTHRHSMLLCRISLLGAAGAAGFVLGRVDARGPKPSDYELFAPGYTAHVTTEQSVWYLTAHLLDARDQVGASLCPTTGYAWTPEGQTWELVESASPSSKRYYPPLVLLPDARVFLPCTGSALSNDPSPPFPVVNR